MKWNLLNRGLQAFVFPQQCVVCGGCTLNPDFSPWCESCRRAAKPFLGPRCDCCGAPTPGNLLDSYFLCSRCQSEGFAFDRATAWGSYEGALRQVIREYKFGALQRLGWPLARLMEEAAGAFGEQHFDYLIAIPSHPKRKRKHGFDHTRLLSERLSGALQVAPFSGLRRVVNTRPQFGLSPLERSRNLKNAFRLDKGALLEKRSLLLVDDILTTGSTAHEVSQLLRREASPSFIGVLTIARVPRISDL